MTSIHCHHPAVIFWKNSYADAPCPDCGQVVPNNQRFPTVPGYLQERPGTDPTAIAVP